MKWPKQPYIRPTATNHGVGPLDLDLEMARRQGWSEAQLERTAKAIGTLSRREAAIAHRKGPVPGCPCVVCDFSIKLEDLPNEYKKARKRITK